MGDSATTTVEHFSDVGSVEAANEAVLENDMALRIQPPAPGATRYYYLDDSKGWVRKKAGLETAVAVDVEVVRRAVKRAIPKNDLKGGGGIKAIDKAEMR